MASKHETPPVPEQLDQVGRLEEDILECIEDRVHAEGGMHLACVLAALGRVVTRVIIRHCYGPAAVVRWFEEGAEKSKALAAELPASVKDHPELEGDGWQAWFIDRVRWN